MSDSAVEEQTNDRILLIKDLYNKLFKKVTKQLVDKKLIVKNGAIVDTTVITSARRPHKTIKGELAVDRKEDEIKEENKVKITYSDDKEAACLIKRGRFHYGYKGHNLVNYDGYFLGRHVTCANVSDINQLEEMINESGIEKGSHILADKGYMSKKM